MTIFMKRDYPLRRRLAWGLMALLLAGLGVRLGVWQLGRAHEKAHRADLVAERRVQDPLAPDALARAAEQAPDQWQRRISLTGRWQADRTVYLANRTMDGRTGFEVMTPLSLAPGDAVFVLRGWVPRDPVDPARLPALAALRAGPAAADGMPLPVQVRGHLAPPPAHWVSLGPEGAGPIRQNLDLAGFTQQTGQPLRPLILVQDQPDLPAGAPLSAPPAAEDGLLRHWAAPDLQIDRNYGYAFQWFAMATAVLLAALWFLLLRPRLRAAS